MDERSLVSLCHSAFPVKIQLKTNEQKKWGDSLASVPGAVLMLSVPLYLTHSLFLTGSEKRA